jgi:uncharacterized protein (TIGR00296 family)
MSITAAVEDTRFNPISEKELDSIVIEISVLSVPELIVVSNSDDYFSKIEIGKDGLIVKSGSRSGLLLPQVPIEQEPVWDIKTFLEHTCLKAWLPKDAWKNVKETKIEKFQAQIFNEAH